MSNNNQQHTIDFTKATQNIEKLLHMLSMELLRIREVKDIKTMHHVKLEIDRVIKTEYEKFQQTLEEAYIAALDGNEERIVNGYLVTYKPLNRFVLDNKKIYEYFKERGMTEEEYKHQFYSHTTTKPILKFKSIT